jgi:thermitase
MRDDYVLMHPAARAARIVGHRLAVRWNEGTGADERAAVLERHALRPVTLTRDDAARVLATVAPQRPIAASDAPAAPADAAEIPAAAGRPPGFDSNQSAGLAMVETSAGTPLSTREADALQAEPAVLWISPVFQAAGTEGPQSQFAVNPARLYVSPSLAAGLDTAAGAPVPFTVNAARTAALHSTLVCLEIGEPSFAQGRSAMDLADWLAGREDAAPARTAAPGDVQFETIPLLSPLVCGCGGSAPAPHAAAPFVPNDPLFPQAWGLARMDAPGAWSIARGAPEVVVAVLDQGVDLSHPDLALYPQSWNTSTDTPNGGPTGPHGTACAGIVAARGNNALGGIGVAPGCRVMAIATLTFADVDVAEGLYFAADNGARVVSMSFGAYPSWNIWNFNLIRDALQYCHDRGLVLVAAAGNENAPVSRFPGSDARTICVGGLNRADQRKHIGDSSAEPFWGACYGPDLDVIAPCLQIPTTDIQGAPGYTPGDYDPAFDGTSAATPHVAGLAALILSRCPELTNVDVRQVIESTCDKVSPSLYPYGYVAAKPSGSWHQETGYGSVNARAALVAAVRRCPVPEPCCDEPKVCLEPTPCECRAPAAPPWLPFDQCMTWYQTVIVPNPAAPRRLIRVVYEHRLCAKGRRQGPLLYTTTLLPGETIRLYHYERFRRVTSATERVTVSTSFRNSMAELYETRQLVVTDSLFHSTTGSSKSADMGGGFNFLGFGSHASASAGIETSTEVGLNIHAVSESFSQVAVAASQAVDAERSVVVSNYEDHEVQDVTQRTISNLNHCFAVTYYVRRVMEVYTVSTVVKQVDWADYDIRTAQAARTVDIRARRTTLASFLGFSAATASPPAPPPAPAWRPLHEADQSVRVQYAEWLRRVPRVGDVVEAPHDIALPTDGVLYEAELAHCSSCEPARGMEVLVALERAQCDARKVCVEGEMMETEVERRRALLAGGVLAPF